MANALGKSHWMTELSNSDFLYLTPFLFEKDKPWLLKNDYLAEIFLKNKQSMSLQGKQVVIIGANNNIQSLK